MLFLPREEGQGLVEYALILVLVAIDHYSFEAPPIGGASTCIVG